MTNPGIDSIVQRLRSEARLDHSTQIKATQLHDKAMHRARSQYQSEVGAHVEEFASRMLARNGEGAELYHVLDRPVWSHAPWIGKFTLKRHRLAAATTTQIPGWCFAEGGHSKSGFVPVRENMVILATGQVAVEKPYLSTSKHLYGISDDLYHMFNESCGMRRPDAVLGRLLEIEQSCS